MLISEMKTTYNEFTVRCLRNEHHGGKQFEKLWKKAKTPEEFEKAVFESEELKMFQGYGVLSESKRGHTGRVCEMLKKGDFFTTSSDAGSVKVGNGTFSVFISNYHGDGSTKVSVIKRSDFNEHMMIYTGITVQGDTAIYSYDCGDEVMRKIEGKYMVYAYEGMVAFVQLDL